MFHGKSAGSCNNFSSIIIYNFEVFGTYFLYQLNKLAVNDYLLQYTMVLNTCSCLFRLKECHSSQATGILFWYYSVAVTDDMSSKP